MKSEKNHKEDQQPGLCEMLTRAITEHRARTGLYPALLVISDPVSQILDTLVTVHLPPNAINVSVNTFEGIPLARNSRLQGLQAAPLDADHLRVLTVQKHSQLYP